MCGSNSRRSNTNDKLNESELERLALANECSDDDTPQIFSMATNFEKASKTIDVKNIKTQSDLEDLKKKDPFGYYSLPGVRESGFVAGGVVDLSVVVAATSQGNKMVRRRSSISYENIDVQMDFVDDAMADDRVSEDVHDDEGKDDCFDTFIEIFDAKSIGNLA
jgi:hypothetical protein